MTINVNDEEIVSKIGEKIFNGVTIRRTIQYWWYGHNGNENEEMAIMKKHGGNEESGVMSANVKVMKMKEDNESENNESIWQRRKYSIL